MSSGIEKMSLLAGKIISFFFPKKGIIKDITRDVNKILIVKIWATGEALLTTPAIRALKNSFPGAKIDYLVGMRESEILLDNPHIDNLIIIDEKIFIKPEILSIIKLMSSIRRKNYDLCILFHHSFLFVFLFSLTGGSILAGIDRKGEGKLLDIKVGYDERTHQADEYLETVLKLGCKPDNLGLELSIPKTEISRAEKILADNAISDKYIVIASGGGANPKTNMPEKLMPLILWRKLLIKLLPLNKLIVIIGGKGDIPRARKLSSLSSSIINLTGKTDIMEASAIIKNSLAIITNDSLPLHIASALKVPTVAIFGPTNSVRYGPYKNNSYLIISSKAECSPCYKNGYLTDCIRVLCWDNINFNEVIRFIRNIIQTK